jgi:hypothetical protein
MKGENGDTGPGKGLKFFEKMAVNAWEMEYFLSCYVMKAN